MPELASRSHTVLVDTPELESKLVSSVMEAILGFQEPETTGRVTSKRHPSKVVISSRKLAGARTGRRVYATKQQAIDGSKADLRKVIARAVKGVVLESGTKGLLSDPAIFKIALMVDRVLPQARHRSSEATIEKLIDALVETQDPIAQVNAEIDAENAAARYRFMETIPCRTADEVTTDAGSTARNRSQTASRWKAEGKLFAVSFHNLDRFPAFQFKDGRPLPVIAKILAALPDAMSPWETAFWFISTNGWLEGAAPYERLADKDRVTEAARLEGEAVVG